MVIAITGATGLLGRNILFEYIKHHLRRPDGITIYVLGRPDKKHSLSARVRRIVMTDGFAYCGASPAVAARLRRFCGTSIRCIHASLDRPTLGIAPRDLKTLRKQKIDHFFHVAALTDLRHGKVVRDRVMRANVGGAAHTLGLAGSLTIKEFSYVSTAYVCGRKRGLIRPDHLDPDADFRNPYEESKARAESLVREYGARTGTRCRYFRPSILCGRLLEKPIGAVVAFETFYAWAAFFLGIKRRMVGSPDELYTKRVSLPMRLSASPRAALNIVPVDYAAKAIYRISSENHPGSHYHLTNPVDMPLGICVGTSLSLFRITDARVMPSPPKRQTPLERLYYRTAGAIFTPYVDRLPPRFDTNDTLRVTRRYGLACPRIDRQTFSKLLAYAKESDFSPLR